jgi:hypothetical protein
MKGILLLLIFYVTIGCQTKDESSSFNGINQIYLMEIRETLVSIEKRYMLNPLKTALSRNKAYKINHDFQQIDSCIKFGKSDINLKTKLVDVISVYGNERLNKDPALEMRLDIIQDAIKNNTLDRSENYVLLLELFDKIFSNLYQDIDRDVYRFNIVKAYVSSEKSIINLGETYQANVFIAAFDTLQDPIIKFQNYKVEVIDGIGVIRIKDSFKGIKSYGGELEWRIENKDQIVKLPFKILYEVK